jgi:hypothetical protein
MCAVIFKNFIKNGKKSSSVLFCVDKETLDFIKDEFFSVCDCSVNSDKLISCLTQCITEFGNLIIRESLIEWVYYIFFLCLELDFSDFFTRVYGFTNHENLKLQKAGIVALSDMVFDNPLFFHLFFDVVYAIYFF